MIKIKNIAIGLLLVLSMFCVVYNKCIASENKAKLTYEQLTQQYPSMKDYIVQTRKSIKNNWYPPVNSFEHSAIIVLTINKDGSLANCYLSQPSEDEGFNNSLIEAARKVNYKPLPAEVKNDSVDIDMLFNMQRRHISRPSAQN